MTYSANLIDEPWIPCLMVDGSFQELNLADALQRSGEIREISDASPLVTICIHRLLLAILHSALQGPASPEDWEAMWRAGGWDQSEVSAYLRKWHDRFDLFHPQQPFFQTSAVEETYTKPVGQMVIGMTLGNYTTLFDHTVSAALSPAEAARQLLAYHAFTVGGMIGHRKEEPGKTHKFTKAGPLAKGAVILIRGIHLTETLLLNLHQYDPSSDIPMPVLKQDLPAWERDEPTGVVERIPDGYIDLLTWQSRRVRLVPETQPDGAVVVRNAVLMKGWQLGIDPLQAGETMVAFAPNPNAKKGESSWIAVGIRADRSLWRDSTALYQSLGGYGKPMPMLTWISGHSETIGREAHLQLDVAGIVTNQANIDLWRRERLPLPPALLETENGALLATIERAIEYADAVSKTLTHGWDPQGKSQVPRPLQILASELLSVGDRNPDQRDVRALVDSLDPTDRYWARLEAPFKDLIVHLEQLGSEGALRSWGKTLYDTARLAFRSTTRGIEANARANRAVAQAERRFNVLLRQTLGDLAPPSLLDSSALEDQHAAAD